MAVKLPHAPRCGRFRVQIPSGPNLTQCCKWFVTASTSTQVYS